MSTFEELSLPSFLLERLAEMKFTEPTEIQSSAIPPLLEGKDVIVQSQTGSGKTLAYLLPILGRLEPSEKKLQAIVLAPSRELGMQILEEIRKLTPGTGLTGQQLIGGTNVRHQLDRLKKNPQIVVGTPGRICELILDGKLKVSGLRFIVLDEVDQVFSFRKELGQIAKALPNARQTVFVSATINPEVLERSSRWMRDASHVKIEGNTAMPDSIAHSFILCETRDKIDVLHRLILASRPQAAISFLNEGRKMDEVYSKLKYKGLKVEALQGEGNKNERGSALKALRDGTSNVLLTTELGARGLDIKGVTHVFNLDLPTDADHYLHRAGRCGRMGEPGTIVSLVAPSEAFVVEKFAKALGIPIPAVELSFGKVVPAEKNKQ